ncbi:SDR family NAD(P)-dependent oxidoreductase [Variovorax sp. J22P168]|uniref:SDR family NAD(P)-dependent oxidoreductase n=1 Tax=Variovorax jilinensis TaxID=3053513 RepID=UPI002577A1B5|nr:SDR family NAD(P)-dependent oxidoreductase [Variovorax sp. J22P168]MDM0014444.1 SDR family NAD(P)-dependent oxidoreductase [Variovorax sp. J22P168]
MRFEGKTVVVTGAASGIGRASALRFAAEGAQVVAADIDAVGGEALAAQSGGRIVFQRTDVCEVDQIRALMDFAAERSGGIDVLFNNAGAGGARARIDEIDAEAWDRTMNLLLRSVAMGIRHAVPHMIARGGGAIVNTASVAALSTGMAPTAYSVAKAGVLQLSKTAAADLARHRIRVNAVCPGLIRTGIFSASFDVPQALKASVDEMVAAMAAKAQPVARAGTAEDIAGAVSYLASDDAAFVTGTHLLVDGGMLVGPRHSWDPETPGMGEAIRRRVEASMAAQAAAR